MSLTRRTLLLGAGSGLSVLALSACVTDAPTPAPTATPRPTVGAVPEPARLLRSNWAGDPYARGATSYLRVGTLPQVRETLRQPILDRLFLAGEAISDDPGTVRGAVESGAAAARQVMQVAGSAERIAVIGAGAAGAEAARLLAGAAWDVVVIEARDRVGGRIDSRSADDGPTIELGAWRLAPGPDDSVIGKLAQAGIDVVALEGASAFTADTADSIAEVTVDDPLRQTAAIALAEAIEVAQQQPADLSVADAVQQSGLVDADDDGVLVVTQFLAELAGATGADPAELSSWFAAPAPSLLTSVADGPMSAVVEQALEGIDPALSTVVTGLFYDSDGVSLRLGTGESLAVDRVIVTVPLGVLKEQAVEFDPPLPLVHRAALEQLEVGHIEIVALEFDEAFWTTDAVLWFRDDDDAPIRYWVNMLPITGRALLIGVSSADAAVAISALNDAEVLASALTSLAPFA